MTGLGPSSLFSDYFLLFSKSLLTSKKIARMVVSRRVSGLRRENENAYPAPSLAHHSQLQLTAGLDYKGTISFTYRRALGRNLPGTRLRGSQHQRPAAFTVTVLTSGSAMLAPKITARRSPHTPASPGAFAVALGNLCFILVLRSYREAGGATLASGPQASRWETVCAMGALLIFIPLYSQRTAAEVDRQMRLQPRNLPS